MSEQLQGVAGKVQQAMEGAAAQAAGAAEGAAAEAEAWQVRSVPAYLQAQLLRYRHEKLKLVQLCVAVLEAARRE
jgi:hypothetical protein